MSIAGKCLFPNWRGTSLAVDQPNDSAEHLREQVLAAVGNKTSLNIVGNSSKSFYGRQAQGRPLVVSDHNGILNYEPTELVLTARCGTRLTDIEAVLADQNQMLAFEPPQFGPNATLGGAIACGLSGPRRPYNGSVRDAVLGVKLLNGRGEILRFGGEVMKNVAGFDVSRLMAGALGTLGVLLEVSIKVSPLPAAELTLVFEIDATAALKKMNGLSGRNWPLSGACYDGKYLKIRLSGSDSALAAAKKQLNGDVQPADEAALFWLDVREQKLPFFQQEEAALWRLSLPSSATKPQFSGSYFWDWGGALWWLKTHEPAETIFAQAQALGGNACRFRSAQGGLFQPLSPGLEKLHKRIKAAFDPHGLFNPGRLYPNL